MLLTFYTLWLPGFVRSVPVVSSSWPHWLGSSAALACWWWWAVDRTWQEIEPQIHYTCWAVVPSVCRGHCTGPWKTLHAMLLTLNLQPLVYTILFSLIVKQVPLLMEITHEFWFWRYLTQGAYLTFKSIFHKALYLFKFDCEITI